MPSLTRTHKWLVYTTSLAFAFPHLTQGRNCLPEETLDKIKQRVQEGIHDQMKGTFTEYYVSSKMTEDYSCAYMEITPESGQRRKFSIAINIDWGKGKAKRRYPLRMTELDDGVLEVRGPLLGVLITRIYPVLATADTIAYYMCFAIKGFLKHDDLLAIGVRSERINDSDNIKSLIDTSLDQLKNLGLGDSLSNIIKRPQVCP